MTVLASPIALIPAANAAAPEVTAPISQVTVYVDGAVVERRFQVDPGVEVVRITGLSLLLDTGSVVAQVLSVDDAGIAAEAVGTTLEIHTPAPTAVSQGLSAELQQAKQVIAHQTTLVATARQRLERLGKLGDHHRPHPQRGQPPAAIPVTGRLALLSFRERMMEALHQDLTAKQEALVVAEEALARIQDQLNQASTASATAERSRWSAQVRLRWLEATVPVTVVLRYRVRGAQWNPCYGLAFSADLSQVRLVLRAAVCQNTGEDWPGVSLRVSTAATQDWMPLPSLPSLRLGRRQETPVVAGWRPPVCGTEELYADHDLAFGVTSNRSPMTMVAALTALVPGKIAWGMRIVPMQDIGTTLIIATDQPKSADRQMELQRTLNRTVRLVTLTTKALEKRLTHLYGPKFGFLAELGESAGDPSDLQSTRLARKPGAVVMGSAKETLSPSTMVTGASRRALSARIGSSAKVTWGRGSDDGVGAAAPPSVVERSVAEESVLPDSPAIIDVSRPSPRLLRYQSLRLAGADDVANRGRLRPFGGGGFVPAPPPQFNGGDLQAPARFAQLYSAELPANIPSDRSWHVVDLTTADSGSQVTYIGVPRLDRGCWRVATFTNPLTVALPGGVAECSRDGQHLLTTRLPDVPPGGQVTVGLGVESAISIARNVTYAEESAGMLGGSLVCVHQIAVTVANRLPHAINLEVRERLPVSDDPACVVAVRTASPAFAPVPRPDRPESGFDQDGEPLAGGRRWHLRLEAQAERTLTVDYTLTLPAKSAVVGGNRRET